MNPRLRVWLVLLGAFVLLGGVIVGLYLKKTGENLYEQFYERAAFRAQYFAGLAARHLDSAATLERLLSTVFIATDVLYAQIIRQGKVLAAHERFEGFTLPAEQPDRLLVIRERRSSAGEPYWDVIYSLGEEELSGPSYVRLGLALAPLEQEWQHETLIVLFIAVMVLGVAAALLWWLTGLLGIPVRRGSSRTAPAADDAVLSPTPILLTEEERKQAELAERTEDPAESLRVDDLGKRVFMNGAEIKLSPKEYELLRLLVSEPGRVFSNEEILRTVWAGRQWATAQDVKQYIYFLRKKLEADPEQPKYIVTVRGFGYKLQF
jgi:hypothetical protein